MIFPDLVHKRGGYINLGAYATQWLAEAYPEQALQYSPLNDPELCSKMLADAHELYHVDYSYGGWLEDRTDLWRGNYLKKAGTYLHLGVDLNAAAGTNIATDIPIRILCIDDDNPLVGGWGKRIIAEAPYHGVVLLYAHLDPKSVRCEQWQLIMPDTVFAKIGSPSENGGWYPHVHVQAMTMTAYTDYEDNLDDLDGYGKKDDLHALARQFPDPMQFIRV